MARGSAIIPIVDAVLVSQYVDARIVYRVDEWKKPRSADQKAGQRKRPAWCGAIAANDTPRRY